MRLPEVEKQLITSAHAARTNPSEILDGTLREEYQMG